MENNNNFQFDQGGGNQPEQPQFEQQLQNNQQQFGVQGGEGGQANQPLFGAPMQQQFGEPMKNGVWSPSNGSPKKKKGLVIAIISIVVLVLLLLSVFGVYAFTSFNTQKSTTSSVQNENKEDKVVEFVINANSSYALSAKAKGIKRDVKVKKDITNATVYMFEVENTGKYSTNVYSLNGLSKDGALVRPISSYDVEDSSILEDNNCKTIGAQLDKGEKKTICMVYPESVAKFLVPERKESEELYRPFDVDSEVKSSTKFATDNKKKGDAISTKDYDKKTITSTTFGDTKEATDKDGKKLFAIETTLSIEEDIKYASRDYMYLFIELEDGTFYRENYSDYKIEGTLSSSELSKRTSEPGKKGEKIKYTATFPRADKKVKNLLVFRNNTEARHLAEVTTIFPA